MGCVDLATYLQIRYKLVNCMYHSQLYDSDNWPASEVQLLIFFLLFFTFSSSRVHFDAFRCFEVKVAAKSSRAGETTGETTVIPCLLAVGRYMLFCSDGGTRSTLGTFLFIFLVKCI